jgi:hypothetical protein
MPDFGSNPRVAFFIDGFNLYHSVKAAEQLRFFDNSSGINLSRDSEFTGYKVKHGGHVYG